GAALLAACGIASHESAALALLALPAAAWRRASGPPDSQRPGRPHPAAAALASTALVLGAWVLGYRIALAHGVRLPPRPAGMFPLAHAPDLLSRAIPAALDLEDQAPLRRAALWIGYGCVAALALVRLARPEARAP